VPQEITPTEAPATPDSYKNPSALY
jgi:hypothetical protein